MSIQLFIPTFRVEECLAEIRECLEKGWTGLGYKTVEFERQWKEYTGLNNAHFLNSATAGLDLALRTFKYKFNWQEDDEVITTPMTFVSTNHAILYQGMKVVFADVDNQLCLDPVDVVNKITSKTKAVLFVGIGGNTGQFEQIVQICKDRNLILILDAAHMAGTRLNGKVPGREADAVVFSFQAVKNLPTADSGMICFKEDEDDDHCRKMTWLGINKDTFTRSNDKGAYKWKYDVEHVGFKYHGNSIMAGIAMVQLKYLDQDNAYRRQLAKWYDDRLSGQSHIEAISVAEGCESSRHLYIVNINNRDEVLLALNESDIFPGVHYRDNTEYSMYAHLKGTCPQAHILSERILSLPMHLRLTKSDVDYICDHLIKYASV